MTSEIDPAEYEGRIGQTNTYKIGLIPRQTARRYARAVEDDNPLFHNIEYAREQGYNDIVVPPNYLPAIIDHTEGTPAENLREDGLDPNRFPIPLPSEAILMGGGQELDIHRYVTAGEIINVEETLENIYQRKSSKMGILTFVEQTAEYYTDEDHILTCDKTMIVGDRQ